MAENHCRRHSGGGWPLCLPSCPRSSDCDTEFRFAIPLKSLRLCPTISAESRWFFGSLGLHAASYWLAWPDRCRWYREVGTGLYFLNLFTLCLILNLFLNGVWVN